MKKVLLVLSCIVFSALSGFSQDKADPTPGDGIGNYDHWRVKEKPEWKAKDDTHWYGLGLGIYIAPTYEYESHEGNWLFRSIPGDTDGDGIMDKDDSCPLVAGVESGLGCPDADGDGIVDDEDKCPQVAGLANFMGCPDTDGDGIVDSEDTCPTVKGSVNMYGCPDSDGDGIADKDDSCPQVAGLANMAGCPDSDKDGIADADDKCPTIAGTTVNKGCPEIKVEDKEAIRRIAKNIYFESGKDVIKATSKTKLDELVKILQKYPKVKMSIEGHTDNRGKDEMNLALSDKRANAVKEYLGSHGIDASRLSAQGFGEVKPVATNDTSAGRAQNRRVELQTSYF